MLVDPVKDERNDGIAHEQRDERRAEGVMEPVEEDGRETHDRDDDHRSDKEIRDTRDREPHEEPEDEKDHHLEYQPVRDDIPNRFAQVMHGSILSKCRRSVGKTDP